MYACSAPKAQQKLTIYRSTSFLDDHPGAFSRSQSKRLELIPPSHARRWQEDPR